MKQLECNQPHFLLNCNQTLLFNSIWIGIHVRRGDYLSTRAMIN